LVYKAAPCPERKDGHDHLREVAEGGVEEPPHRGVGVVGQLLGDEPQALRQRADADEREREDPAIGSAGE